MMNNLYLISQHTNNRYETYDSIVVSAKDEDEARKINPDGSVTHYRDGKWMGTRDDGTEYERDYCEWVEFKDIDQLTVQFIGKTELESGVIILGSFNAA